MELTPQQLRKFARIQRKKYHVSVPFLKHNMANIEKFLWYALTPRLTIKRMAVRKRRSQRVVLDYYHLRRVLFDQMDRKLIKARKRNAQQWSRRMVCYLRNNNGVKEYVEETPYGQPDSECSRASGPKATIATEAVSSLPPEEVSKQMKQQLELLRSGKRTVPLIEDVTTEAAADAKNEKAASREKEDEPASGTSEGTASATTPEKESTIDNATGEIAADGGEATTSHAESHPVGKRLVLKKTDTLQNKLETTPEKQIMLGRSDSFLDSLQNPRAKTQRTEASTDDSCAAEEFIHVPCATVTAIAAPDVNADIVEEPAPKKLRMFAPLDIEPEVNKVPATVGVGGRNFLDMLMNKVGMKGVNSELPAATIVPTATAPGAELRETRENSLPSASKSQESEHFTDSSEEFFGFDETERVPGMMLTPLVPHCVRSKGADNSAFVSESLNEYLRENSLETSSANDGEGDSVAARRHRQANLDGLVTPGCTPPHMDMPLVPESLQKLRTVAERRQYLQKFHKNHKLSIINNEATVYRELQRKTRLQKSKSVSQQVLQAPNAQMPFTRRGWQAASFVTTEFNKYYYQMLKVDGEFVRLPGVRGNNEERYKGAYRSRVTAPRHCSESCCDLLAWRDFKPIKTTTNKKKLNKAPLPTVFKPCPLSHKPFQKPLDDETAALLLAGGSMAVVRMPTVELQVFPALGKPLHEIAKRYLEYILPHNDISREWAEFSVSTLQQPRSMKETEKVVASSCAPERRKSFTFAIPYLNDRSHILVRRVVDRSEKLDQSFEMAKESDTAMLEDLSFRAHLDTNDEELMDCANVLSDMINSVAISCSENSFIKEDPDGLHAEEMLKTPKLALKDEKPIAGEIEQAKLPATSTQQAANKKQNRMMLELRRLNATIIDAAVKAEKETKPCSKEYCALGCVCTSLADDYPLRQHCGKSKCVIECTCKASNQSRIMRLETDGRSITTEDAFMLRRKATARLARMEKEFTSTIVLTENETLLINESQYDKKRRCTKAPKRYEDFAETDDDYTRTSLSPKKKQSSAVVAIEASESLSSSFSEVTTELREPIFVKDTVLERLKHCSVPLVPFEDTKNMTVWCMVHELYKCYCGGRAIEGKPLLVEKEEPNVTTTHSNTAEVEYVMLPPKARYSFEKAEDEQKRTDLAFENDESTKASDAEQEHNLSEIEEQPVVANTVNKKQQQQKMEESENEDLETESVGDATDSDSDFDANLHRSKKIRRVRSQFKRGRPTEVGIISDYFAMKPSFCRRAVPVPMKSYLRMNRKRRDDVREYIRTHENRQTMLQLNEHIMRSVYFHKNEAEKRKAEQQMQQRTPAAIVERKQKEMPPRTIVDLTDEDSRQSSTASSTSSKHSRRRAAKRLRRLRMQQQLAERKKCEAKELCKHTEEVDLTTQTAESPPSVEIVDGTPDTEDTPAADATKVTASPQQAPRLYKDFTLRGALPEEAPNSKSASVTEESHASTANVSGETPPSVFNRDFNNVVIRYMNNLVSKKMQDIDQALKRESSVIPAPNNEILCIIKWTNFLDAFEEGFVFIWEVKMRDHSFFAATISNMMPLVLDAVGVVNIAALSAAQLPLMGRMLLERCRNEHTRTLAIVMQGRAKYWLVKGFLRPDAASVCQKPTPQTHPSLTRKINVLYNLLMKQRIKEFQRKLLLQQEEREKQIQQEALREKRLRTKELRPTNVQLLLHEFTERWQKFNQPQFETNEEAMQATASPKIDPTCAQPANAQVLLQELQSVEQKCEQFLLENGLETKAAAAARATASPKTVAPTTQTHSTPANHKIANAATAADSGTVKHNNKSDNSSPQPRCQAQNGTAAAASSSSQKQSKKQLQGLNVDLLRDLSGQAGCTLMTTNIEFRKVTKEDIDEIHEPEVYTDDHRWLVLDLHSDFSHIFVPDFRDLVSLDRIHKVMAFSRQKQKIVKLQFFQDAPFNAFVTPSSMRKIYFGPLQLNSRPPLLILLQSVDGQMMLREIYQREHNIQSNASERTTAFWILRINGHTHFEYDVESGGGDTIEILPDTGTSKEADSDDDCMIVEDNQTHSTAFYQQPAALSEDMNISQPCVGNTTSFTIETNANTNQLQITPQLSGATELNFQQSTPFLPIRLPLAASLVQLPLPTQQSTGGLTLPSNAVITGVASAPKEAAYGTTIYISNVPPADNALSGENAPSEDREEIQQSAGDSANVATTKTTFLTPDVCVTATTSDANDAKTAAGRTPTATPPSSTTPFGQQLAAIGTNAMDTIDNLIKLPTAPKSQRSTGIYVMPKPSSREQLKKPTTPSSDTTRQRTSCSPQNNPPTPTYITPEVQVTTAAREAWDGAAPIKRRRYSCFHHTADGRIALEQRKSTKNGELPATVDEKPENALQRVSTIGCTTITKVADEVSKQKLRLRPDEQQPIVMPLQFLGDDDEPAASIVFKPMPDEAAKNAEAPTDRVLIGQTLYKRTATGLMKMATTTKAATAETSAKSPVKASAAPSAVAINTAKLTTALKVVKSPATTNTPKLLTLANVVGKQATSMSPNALIMNRHSASSTSTATDRVIAATTTKLPTLSRTPTSGGSSGNVAVKNTNSTLKVRTLPTEVATNEAAAAGNRYGLTTAARPITGGVRPVQQRSSLPIISSVTSAAPSATSVSRITSVTSAAPSATSVSRIASVTPTAASSNAAVTPKPPIFNIKPAVPIPQRRNSLPVKCNPKQVLATAIRSSPQAARILNASSIKTQAKLVVTGSTATATTNRVIATVAMTTNNKLPTTAVTSHFSQARYGIFSCSVPSAPKFLAKFVNGIYLIKVLGVGTVQLKGLQAVNNYLNSHLMKTPGPWQNKPRAEWVFVPQEHLRSPKIIFKQGASTTQKIVISGRSAMRPKVSKPAVAKTEADTITMCNSSKMLANAAAAMSNNVLNDPILIDD